MVELDRGFVSGSGIPEEYSLHSRLQSKLKAVLDAQKVPHMDIPNV